MEQFINYAPVIVVILVFLLQQKIFVTPEQLERKHREILDDAQKKFASHQSLKDLKDQFMEIKEKIDKIYDCIIGHKIN